MEICLSSHIVVSNVIIKKWIQQVYGSYNWMTDTFVQRIYYAVIGYTCYHSACLLCVQSPQ